MTDVISCPQCGSPRQLDERYCSRKCVVCVRESNRRSRKANPLKGAARAKAIVRAKAKMALRRGALVRQPCEVCGAAAEMHHDDYTKPTAVRWLCRAHHLAWHATNEPAPPKLQPKLSRYGKRILVPGKLRAVDIAERETISTSRA